MSENAIWIAIGLIGQALFSARFILQWLASEKARRSVVPKAFWYFSLAGSTVLLAYAIHRVDPVFILGQAAGFAIYLRNLWLIEVEHRRSLSEDGA
jgi:lipid-A-disaccharide synthase-like uncharacterized protein